MTPYEKVTIIESLERERTRSLGTLEEVGGDAGARFPLAKVEISARIAGYVAETTLIQTFRNDNAEPLEAVYIFPLPGTCSVSAFQMKFADRTLCTELHEREKARKDYERAVEEGKLAGILEKERDGVFTIRVGNIPAGEEATVTLTLSERLPLLTDGTTELRLPLVVAPRYIPGQPLEGGSVGDGVVADTDVVPDASRITPPILVDGFDPKTDLHIRVSLETQGIKELACSQHVVKTTLDAESAQISLARDDELLNRDFVLRWRAGTEEIESELLVHRTSEGAAYGMLSITPPREEGDRREPRDLLFVLDRSGSMFGAKFASAARSCSMLLQTLASDDRFAILAFDNERDWMEMKRRDERFHPADAENVAAAERFLRQLDGRGGTDMHIALGEAVSAIEHRKDPEGRTPILVLITDGEVGDESRILERIESSAGAIRIFTVGVDTSVNSGFLERMARLGRGICSIVEPGAKLEETLLAIARDLRQPLVTGLRVEGAGAEIVATETAPSRLPDLFPSRASVIYLRLLKDGPLRITGSSGDGEAFERVVMPTHRELPAIERLWARSRIADLEDRYRMYVHGDKEIERQIVDLSIRHAVLSRFTAFIVIDEKEVVDPDGSRRRIVQPVHLPAQWEEARMSAAIPQYIGVLAGAPTESLECRVDGTKHDDITSNRKMDPFEWYQVLPKTIRRRFHDLIEEIHTLFIELVDGLHEGTIPPIDRLEAVTKELRHLLEADQMLRSTGLVRALNKHVEPLLRDLVAEGAGAKKLLRRAKRQQARLIKETVTFHRMLRAEKTRRRFWKEKI